MKSPLHATFIFPPCPLLPEVHEGLDRAVTRALSVRKGPDFYAATFRYAQSLWREGKPAQAILQLNKAFMSDLSGAEEVLQIHPPPYAVLVWFLRHRPEGYFVGNPVRHFQHLATRVSGERKEIRAWRAWACFHLSQTVLPAAEFPVDNEQVAGEGIVFPEWDTVVEVIGRLGWRGEREVIEACAAQSMS
ncbi:hypothetical protein [Haloferula sp. BvORR071]|uniref:hypothetical protein n=1 Tax=Haloferula sp. BvORR071 TaxID=1396141 RepID=UPI002240F8F3|nr:hypothetical protein [Haloferula sp. BvORR071]